MNHNKVKELARQAYLAQEQKKQQEKEAKLENFKKKFAETFGKDIVACLEEEFNGIWVNISTPFFSFHNAKTTIRISLEGHDSWKWEKPFAEKIEKRSPRLLYSPGVEKRDLLLRIIGQLVEELEEEAKKQRDIYLPLNGDFNEKEGMK